MKKFTLSAALLLLILMFFSCATGGVPAGGPTGTPLYYGSGSGTSGLQAMNAAKGMAVRRAAEDLLGPAVTTVKRAELDSFFADVKDFNIYVLPETLQTLSSDGTSYSLMIRVNLKALGNSLAAKMLLGGQVTGGANQSLALADQKPPAGAVPAAAPAAPGKEDPAAPAQETPAPPVAAVPEVPPSPEEQAFINRYMADLTYMVYYNEESPADPFLMKAAVVSANKYLNQNNLKYVDLEQIESLRKDQELVYEEETGQAVSIIQWIAHKLNADIYIEINMSVTGRSEGSRHYGSATITLNNYEASTADGRGAASYQTNPPAFSTVSQVDALNNAVSSAVFQAMPVALSTADRETREAMTRGLKYSLTILNTRDRRLMREFEQKLQRKVRSLRQLSFTPEQSVYEVYLLGEIIDLEDAIYDVADTMPDLEGLALIMQQRSALTFDSGL